MPVCTDSCVFGALVNFENCQQVLDIGAGTGLLSLMLAQRYADLQITAVEIDPAEAENALNNFRNSPWQQRLELINEDILNWNNTEKFDGIVCNPPFFDQQLQSENTHYNRARHQGQLTFEGMLTVIKNSLSENGKACCLIPALHLNEMTLLLEEFNFFTTEIISFKDNRDATPHVHLVEFGFEAPLPAVHSDFVFKEESGIYAADFKQKLAPYYHAL